MSARQTLYQISRRIQRTLVPDLRYSQYLFEDVLQEGVSPDTCWLDLGCGHQVLPSWREESEKDLVARGKTVVGLDYDMSSLRKHKTIHHLVRGTADDLPFEDGVFDLVAANMVVEHLSDPVVQFAEIARVLKPNGVFIFHTPNERGYYVRLSRWLSQGVKDRLARLLQERPADDVFPTYYLANTREEIERLAGDAGFAVEKQRMVVSSAQFMLIPPLVVPELLWIRLMMTRQFSRYRPNIIAVLRRR